MTKSIRFVCGLPPANIPRVLFDKPPNWFLASVRSPKSLELPKLLIVMNSIEFDKEGLSAPRAKSPHVSDATAAPYREAFIDSP